MKTISDIYGYYVQQQPWDFSSNPFRIEYVHESAIHHKTVGLSDISVHLPLLNFLATQCEYIVEFGTREGKSTSAFLMAGPKQLISVDINPTPLVKDLGDLDNWLFIQKSSTDPELSIGRPDMLFIDSDHSYEHVVSELHMHAWAVKKWIVLHDSTSCDGVARAIKEFLVNTGSYWKQVYQTTVNHGLTILQRKDTL